MEKKHALRFVSIAIAFFLLVTTLPLWVVYMGVFGFFIFIGFSLIYFILVIILLTQIILLFDKTKRNKYRLATICVLSTVLYLILCKPFGVINFDDLQGYDYLIAKTGGTRDTFDGVKTLRLTKDGKYKLDHIVFSKSEVKGTYTVKDDTIFFEPTSHKEYLDYQFAVIEDYPIGNARNDTMRNCLILYKDRYSDHGYLMHPEGQMLEDMGIK